LQAQVFTSVMDPAAQSKVMLPLPEQVLHCVHVVPLP
jgi:hypothetical protein